MFDNLINWVSFLFIVKDLSRSPDPISRLKLVEAAAKEHLFISSPFDPLQVGSGKQDSQLCSFLQQCKQIHQQRSHRAGAGLVRAGAGLVRASSHKERVLCAGGGGGREAAHIAARSYEALHSKQTSQTSHSAPQTSAPKKYPDLYVQGASSFTDLSSRRVGHESMVHGGTRSLSKHHSSGSSDSLDLYAPFMGNLDRVQSMESGISQEQQAISWKIGNEQTATLPRSASQGHLPPAVYPSHPPPRPPLNKAMARSTENFHTQTPHGLLSSGRRTPSYVHLSGGNEDWTERLDGLEDRLGLLAKRFLYERQDVFKQILRACEFMPAAACEL